MTAVPSRWLSTALMSASAALLLSQAALAAEREIGSLRLIGEQDVAFETMFANTPVGGLSGIDYDAANGTWYLISDDRSAKAPARFYTARIAFDDKTVSPLEFLSVVTLTQPDGNPFPNAEAGGEVPDPESIRLDPKGGALWWTSEGDRKLGLAPTLREAALGRPLQAGAADARNVRGACGQGERRAQQSRLRGPELFRPMARRCGSCWRRRSTRTGRRPHPMPAP